MRAGRRDPVVIAVTAALVLAAVAGPVRAGAAPWLTATPVSSPIALTAGGSATVTVTNTDRRASSNALTVTLATKPSSAPFEIVGDGCTGMVLGPGASCTVEVGYQGPPPTADQTAALTVASAKPRKASVTRTLEVGVTFADVCVARGGSASVGGTITVLGSTFAVGDRCDWNENLATAFYNATFEALSPECFDLGYSGTVGYPVTAETGRTAIGCVVG
ncbi:MAG: hypothetical protein WEC14_11200 [Chloroflexota bacterium]